MSKKHDTESYHWFTPSHEVVQGVAMVSEVVDTRSKGCEDSELSCRGKLNSSLSRQLSL